MIGQLLDAKYQIVRLLGEGGMGAVYEAVHTGTGRRVAVKVILSADLAKNQDMVTRFQREARAAGAIDTQHIVQVLDTGRDPTTGFPFLVLEFLSGGDLSELVRRVGPLPPDLALRIAAQACLGLQKAHEANVVHRDIKPANLYLARRDGGEVLVKVLDFGIAKVKMDQAQNAESHGLTRTGSILGSPSYMSPEQAKGLKTIDHRTDVWSIGAVLYEALTGRTPHHDVDTLGQLIIAICAEPPPPLQSFAPWVPPEVAAIAHQCLSIDPAQRFPTAAAMLHAIAALLPQGHHIHQSMLVPVSDAHRASSAPRLPVTGGGAIGASSLMGATVPAAGAAITGGGPPASHAMTPAPAASPKRSSGGALLVGAALVVALAGFGVYRYGRSSQAVGPAGGAVPSASTEAPPPLPPPASASAPIAPQELPRRKVKLVVIPSHASVEVDGAAAQSREGIIEITGALGTMHTVKVSLGPRETTAEIVISEGGAVPPKVELGVTPPRPARGPGTSGARTPPAPGSDKGAVPSPTSIDKRFE